MTHQNAPHHRWQLLAVALAILLTAFAFRLWGLNETSLWYDETFVLYHARNGPVNAIIGLLQEDNALPLHGLLLSLWIKIAGSSEFAVRYLSVLLGISAVPLIWRLGYLVSNHRVSGAGGALAYGTLPIFVYYTQEVRMYALAIPLAIGFMWAGWVLVTHRRAGAAYVILGLLMLTAHLYTALAWASIGVWGSITIILNGRRNGTGGLHTLLTHRHWWQANLTLAACSSPILFWAYWRAHVDATAVSAIPVNTLRWLPTFYGVGQYLPPPWAPIFIALTIAALWTAVVASLDRRSLPGGIWLVTANTLPIALLFALTSLKAKWNERYLLPSMGVALVVGVGIGVELLLKRSPPRTPKPWHSTLDKSRRLLGIVLTITWLALATVASAHQAQGTWAIALRDEWHPRPDFRGLVHYIEAHDTPQDSIVVIGGHAMTTVSYYYQGPAHIFGLPSDERVLDRRHVIDLHTLETLERELEDSKRLWLVLWQQHLTDPTNLVQSTLVEACHRLPVEQSFTNIGLLLFDVSKCRPLDRRMNPPHLLTVPFQDPIQLRGYNEIVSDQTLEVDLWWQTTGELRKDYIVFVHLLDVDGTIITQHDHIAGADTYPTSQWPVGTYLRDRFFLEVPNGTCEGCHLQVGLYTQQGRLPLLHSDNDAIELPLLFTLSPGNP